MADEEYKRFEFQYGLILLRTRRFQSLMDSLGSRKITRPASWFLLYLMPVAAAVGFYIFFSEIAILLSPRGAAIGSYIRSLGPLANIGLPGINPYLPIVYGWIALIVGIVVHEGAHGVVARSLGLPVKSSGLLLFLFVPIGAFVDVDENAVKEAKGSHAGRMLAAGAGLNLVVGVVCLLLMLGVVSTMRPANPQGVGVFVVDGSPLSQAGVRNYDFIVAANGTPLNDIPSIGASSWYQINNTVTLTVWRDGTTFDQNVTIGQRQFENVSSGQKFYLPYLGVSLQNPTSRSASDLTNFVSFYSGSALTRPLLYVCIPTIPTCQGVVPFSDTMSGFFTSSLGRSLVPLANLFYWLFFINFNLAIFNSLPIYPLDGGQAFRVGVKGLGRFDEKTVMKITGVATIAVLALVLGVVVGPYLLA